MTEVSSQKPASKLTLWGLLEVASLTLCAATLARFLAGLWWLFELTSHFPLPLAGMLILLAALWAIAKRWRMTGICAVFGAINLALIYFSIGTAPNPPSGTGVHLRLVSMNVLTSNERSDLALQFLRDSNPDVILLMEVNHRWLEELKSLETTHPHFILRSREDNFGIALFCRVPLTNASIVQLGEAPIPTIVTDLVLSNRTVHLIGTHPIPPGTARMGWLRDEQLERLAIYARKQTSEVIVMGDLNVTPWSPKFSALLRDSGLSSTFQPGDVWGTWPAWSPIRIPLDHCLISPSIHLLKKGVGPPINSDHLPIIVDLDISIR